MLKIISNHSKNKFLLCIIFICAILVPKFSLASNLPSGILVRAKFYPQVFFIENNQKHYIESPQMLQSRFEWSDVILTSKADLDAISQGEPMKFRDGTLVSNNGSVYVISDGKRRPIASAAVFLDLGYRWDNIMTVSNAELSPHPLGDQITTNSQHPNGALIKGSDSEVYYLDGGKKRYIPSPLIFISRFRWEQLITVSQQELNSYTQGDNLFYPDGLMISSATSVFIMENNARRPIGSPEIFESYGLRWDRIRRATDYDLSIMPIGPTFSDVKGFNDGTLVKGDNSGAIYKVENGVLKNIISPNIFLSYGYSWDEVLEFPKRVIDRYTKSGNIGFNEGALIAGPGNTNATVYKVEGGFKRGIASPQVFSALGFRWDNVRFVSQAELDLHATGSVINAVTTANLEGYSIPASTGGAAREQHLVRDCNETIDDHYNRAGTSPGAKNNFPRTGEGKGVGGTYAGTCASGSVNASSAPASVEEEKYYVTMRWNYITWYEATSAVSSSMDTNTGQIDLANASDFPGSGYVKIDNEIIAYTNKSGNTLYGITRGYDNTGVTNHGSGAGVKHVYYYSGRGWIGKTLTKDFNSSAKIWHKKKKVMIRNPRTGKSVIASILESGPAIFTNRVGGLSPEAWEAIEARTDETLEWGFLIDQNRSLGTVN